MNATSTHIPAGIPARLTPGGYMRDCRKRSGKKISDCAKELAIRENDRNYARRDLIALERNQPGDYSHLVRLLRDRAVYPFNYAIFAGLAAETSCPSLDHFQ